MGAPCWDSSYFGYLDQTCDITCLCPNPMPGVPLGDTAPTLEKGGECVRHLEDYVTVASIAEADGLIEDLRAAGAAGAAGPAKPLDACATCSIVGGP